jgi:ABC-type nickel/cobalt efflux system permease component RcnA
MPERVTWKSLLALGVSGGLLPCPEALMVLLITIAAHRVLFGLLLILSFSTGLAAVLVGFGLLLVYARGFFSRINLSGGLAPRLLPVVSALVIVIAGGVITAQALPQVL